MASALVEYLVNQQKSNGEPLCFHSGAATWVPAFPAQTSTTFYLGPGQGEFAYLLYRVLWDTANLPQAFQIYAQHGGGRPFDGIVHQIFGDIGIEGWLTITEAQKLLVRITNRSNLVQRLSYGFNWLTVKTKEDWDVIVKELEYYASDERNNRLIKQTNQLLQQMVLQSHLQPPQPVYVVPHPPLAPSLR